MQTRTGSFGIGFRRGWSQWQKDLKSLTAWAASVGFDALDLNAATAEDVATVTAAGLNLGSVDLLKIGEIAHPDEGKRKEIVAQNVEYIRAAAGWGAKSFFTIVAADPTRKRAENFKTAVEAFGPIADAAAASGVTVAVEAYPGGGPHYALLCTTPETTRAFLKELPRGIGINYDPSHYIRLGVDHVRFLNEFAGHVVHVHGKDTELFPEAIYEYGLYQPSAFATGHGFGEHTWRYTLPGHGVARWTEIFKTLQTVGYAGKVSIELEDEHFNGSEAGEKTGLEGAMRFLATA